MTSHFFRSHSRRRVAGGAGCGSSSPAGGTGTGGNGGTARRTTASGTGGTYGQRYGAGRPASAERRTSGSDGRRRRAATGVDGERDRRARQATGGVGRRQVPVGSPQCSDGIDNDGDGKIDYDDPECVGPLDNDESSFATGIPGDNMDACKQDCFFDGNSGAGRRRLQLAAEVRPAERRAEVSRTISSTPRNTRTECSMSASQSSDLRRQVPQAGAERL